MKTNTNLKAQITDNINDIAKVYDVSTKDPRLIMEILQVSKQIDKDFGENLLIKAKKLLQEVYYIKIKINHIFLGDDFLVKIISIK